LLLSFKFRQTFEQQAGASPPQVVPHVPQLLASFGTHWPAQHRSPALGHGRIASHITPASGGVVIVHMPDMQSSPSVHILPQTPQLLSSSLAWTH
jgi:hypothetical protein